MLAFLTRTRRPAPPARPRSFRPRLEWLEERDCPSSLTLNWQLTGQTNVSFTGQYSGAANVAKQTVTLTGPGWTQTVTTDANGNFHVVVAMPQLGNVTASVQDAAANVPQVNVNPPVPYISTFLVIQNTDGTIELKGWVIGTPDPQGMVVRFTGMPVPNGTTATCGADGSFDIIVTPTPYPGPIYAMTTDCWGRNSNKILGEPGA
jgi:hypothetical protein